MKKYTWVLILVFSLIYSCQDRVFNNPLDPNQDKQGYEIQAIIPIGTLSPVDLTFSGDALWMIDSTYRIIALNYNSGNIIRELNFSYSLATGICYNGGNLWLTAANSAEIVKISIINGEIINILKLSEGDYSFSDYFDSIVFIFDQLSNTIVKIDEQTGLSLGSVASPSFSSDGICFDGENFWVIDNSASKIYQINSSGDILDSYQAPDTNLSGICYNNGIFWCGDRSGKIYKLKFL